MADVFADFGLATGSNDGTSWEDAYQTPAAFVAGLSATDVGLVKEHAGYTMSASFSVSVNCAVHGGFDSALTGTSYNLSTRTGMTVLNGNAGAYRALTLSGTISMSRMEFYNYSYSTAPLLNLTSGTVDFDTCTFRNSISTGSDDISGMYVSDPAALTLTNCALHDLIGGSFGAIRCDYADLTVDSCQIYDNEGSFGAGIAIYGGSSGVVNITDSSLTGNVGALGGALYAIGVDGVVNIRRTIISGNSASYGSAIQVDSGGSTLLFDNCSITENTTNYTGTIHYEATVGILNLVNCTVADNSNTDTNCAGVETDQDPYIANCIFYGNTTTTGTGSQVSSSDTGGVVTYCDIDDLAGDGISGIATVSNCIDVSPQFIGTGDDPYALSASTPTSVTQGASTGVTGYQDYDVLNNDRDNSTPSMGAYEYIVSFLSCTIGGGLAAVTAAVALSYGALSCSVTGSTNSVLGAADIELAPLDCTVDGLDPSVMASITAELAPLNCGITGYVNSVTGDITADIIGIAFCSIAGSVNSVSGNADLELGPLDCTADGSISGLTGSVLSEFVEALSCTVSGTSPSITGSVQTIIISPCVVAGGISAVTSSVVASMPQAIPGLLGVVHTWVCSVTGIANDLVWEAYPDGLRAPEPPSDPSVNYITYYEISTTGEILHGYNEEVVTPTVKRRYHTEERTTVLGLRIFGNDRKYITQQLSMSVLTFNVRAILQPYVWANTGTGNDVREERDNRWVSWVDLEMTFRTCVQYEEDIMIAQNENITGTIDGLPFNITT